MPHQPLAQLSQPSESLLATLGVLCEDPNNTVVIVTGRKKDDVQEWFRNLPRLGLIADHGFWIRPPRPSRFPSEKSTSCSSTPMAIDLPNESKYCCPEKGITSANAHSIPDGKLYYTSQESTASNKMKSIAEDKSSGGKMLMTENAYSLSKAHILEGHNHPSIPKRYVESREIKDPFHFTCNSTGEQGDNADPRESFESILRPELSDDVCNEQNATLRADKHDDGRDYCDKSDNSGDAIGCMDKKPWPWRLALTSEDLDLTWMIEVMPILEDFTQRTPGSFIEKSECCLTWHYRDTDRDFGISQAKNLQLHFDQMLQRRVI